MATPFLVETYHLESPVPNVILALETSLPTKPKCMVLMETKVDWSRAEQSFPMIF